ncbi:hypothetical protein HPP92_013244 [Vanilla planifolia]|uniref:Uncharacterized protein n=1 Tax=Vanilla planifolia TaxID=51239 RepID=A0A835UZT8_VANPL|nr:hypothetical protein HPP92_013722 [Vanilla planifolia]KAG0478525.1 hypothetical protein HPP92_013244 [Vanilla planifolia]
MGLLDKLWDDTVAGPRPDTGLGRLRKPKPFSLRLNSIEDEVANGVIERSSGGDSSGDAPRITRSIMIKRPAGCPSPVSGTPPASPAGSTPPASPFSGGKEWNRFRRYSSSDAYDRGIGGGMAKNTTSPYEV